MMTTSLPKNIDASVPDAKSNHHSIGQFSYCPHCGDAAGYLSQAPVHPYLPDEPLQCRVCGKLDYDLVFYGLIRKSDNWPVSPNFATKGEAYRYRDIFGATKEAGYQIVEWTFYFHEADDKARSQILAELATSRVTYDRLIELVPVNPSLYDLQAIAIRLGLDRYPLPVFACGASQRAS
ncbi:hypothetical protein [Methylomonas sp. MgM2]